MLFAVLYFDEVSDQTIRQIWQTLADANLSTAVIDKGVPPHITLGSFLPNQPDDIVDQVGQFAQTFAPLAITMPNYDVFTSPQLVVFLGVTVTDVLHNLHRGLYQQFAEHIDNSTLFAPATWLPHCTLAYESNADKLPSILKVCQQFPLPIVATANRLALVDGITAQTLVEFPFQTTN